MKILAITQARIGSSRLPEKVLLPLGEGTILSAQLNALKKSSYLDKIIVATTFEDQSEKIVSLCNDLQIDVFQGDLDDVLDRFYKASINYHPDLVVRLTSDCPLLDINLLDDMLLFAKENEGKYDYISNNLNPTFPDGMDIEIFTFKSLEKAFEDATLVSEREHVTPYIWKNSDLKGGPLFKAFSFESTSDFSSYRLTIDTMDDYQVLVKAVKEVGIGKGYLDYVNFLKNNPDIMKINHHQNRNEGYAKSLAKDDESSN